MLLLVIAYIDNQKNIYYYVKSSPVAKLDHTWTGRVVDIDVIDGDVTTSVVVVMVTTAAVEVIRVRRPFNNNLKSQ